MRLLSLSLSLSLVTSSLLLGGRAHAEPAAAPATQTMPIVVDEGLLIDALAPLLDGADAARVVVVVSDTDDARRTSIERSLVRVLRDRRREDIITPALVRARLGAAAAAQLNDKGVADTAFAADHVLLADVVSEGGKAAVTMRLLVSASVQLERMCFWSASTVFLQTGDVDRNVLRPRAQ